MLRLKSFVREHRKLSIAIAGVLAVALTGCCLIALLAGEGEERRRSEELSYTPAIAEPAEASPPIDTAEPTETSLPPTAANTPQPTDAPEPTDTPRPIATPTPERSEAEVVEVVDGDSIVVDIAGAIYDLRYIGIDTPEWDQPMGAEAEAANERLVSGQTVYLEKDVSETDKYGRLLRYVYLADGTFVNAELVRQGYARAKSYEPDVERQGVLEQAEQQAREDRLGLWGPTPVAPPPPSGQAQVVVDPSCCQFNSPGDDNNTKEQEYVCFANRGSGDADMSGWTVSDEYGWTYKFPAFVLPAGAYVRVATGCGNNTAGTLFWCKDGTAVWNNGGDTVSLYDNSGTLVARYSY